MKKLIGIILFIGLFLFVFAESNYLNNKNLFFEKQSLVALVLGSLGVVMFVFFFPISHGSNATKLPTYFLKIFVTTATVFFILTEALIVDFSGMAFGPEVIFHFSLDSLILGAKEYTLHLILFVIFIIGINIALLNIARFSRSVTRLAPFAFSVVLIASFFNQSIYGRLNEGYAEYKDLMNIRGVYESDIKALSFLDINHIETKKSNIEANTTRNNNLVVIYLESFSALFVDHPNYPNLTPELSNLAKQHHLLSPYISTGHFTMDGLISSHCSFIPNMLMGNNTLASGEKYYFEIPCFTDVLSVAGYYQEFLGGAKKSFAGKGDFLSDHGYDKIWGSEDFLNKYKDEMTWWGLQDADLFDQAIARIEDFQELDQPYHLSMLTLGTHLKGYPSPSCPDYEGSDDLFINAIHCTDYLVGNFVDYLRDHGHLENTTVIITGDHTLFSTSYTKDLFGDKIEGKELFGVIIDDTPNLIFSNMGLYDLPPTILSLLEINHNVKFIMGDAFGGDSSRPMLTRNNLYISGKNTPMTTGCQLDLNKKVTPSEELDICDHRAVISQLYGYTETFNKASDLGFRAESRIEVLFEKDFTVIVDVLLDGDSLRRKIRNNGFILRPERYRRKGVFLIQINHETQKIEQLLNFPEPANLAAFLERRSNMDQSSLVFFGIDGETNHELIEQLNTQFEQLDCKDPFICIRQNDGYDKIALDRSEERFVLSNF